MFRRAGILVTCLAAIGNLDAGSVALETSQVTGGLNYGLTRANNYDSTLFAGSTNAGTPPTPFSCYGNPAGPTATPAGIITAGDGITFALISNRAAPSDSDYRCLLGNNPTIVIPFAVFGVTPVWTMMYGPFGASDATDTDLTLGFETSANDAGGGLHEQ